MERPDRVYGSLAVLVDYENLRISLDRNFTNPPSDEALAGAISVVGAEYGHALISRAYADWTQFRDAARDFQRRGFDPQMVLRKETGRDRSDMTMILDAHELLMERENIATYVLVTGDADFRALIRRLKARGKRVVICAAAKTASRELITEGDPFVPIETKITGLQPIGEVQEEDDYDWEPFIRQLSRAENTLPFVGLKHFRDNWLTDAVPGAGDTEAAHQLLNRAAVMGILEVYKEPNPKNPEFATAAIRLRREHPAVEACLSTEGDVSDTGTEPDTSAPEL